jgi:hypothetical protein
MQIQTGLTIDYFPQEPFSSYLCALSGLFLSPEFTEENALETDWNCCKNIFVGSISSKSTMPPKGYPAAIKPDIARRK